MATEWWNCVINTWILLTITQASKEHLFELVISSLSKHQRETGRVFTKGKDKQFLLHYALDDAKCAYSTKACCSLWWNSQAHHWCSVTKIAQLPFLWFTHIRYCLAWKILEPYLIGNGKSNMVFLIGKATFSRMRLTYISTYLCIGGALTSVMIIAIHTNITSFQNDSKDWIDLLHISLALSLWQDQNAAPLAIYATDVDAFMKYSSIDFNETLS